MPGILGIQLLISHTYLNLRIIGIDNISNVVQTFATPTCPACLWPKHQPSGQTCARWEPFPGAELLHCKDPTKIITSTRLHRNTQEYKHLSTTTYHGLQADALPKFLCLVHLMGGAISLSQWPWRITSATTFFQQETTWEERIRWQAIYIYLLYTVLDKPFKIQNLSSNNGRSSVMTQSESFEIGTKLISVLSIWPTLTQRPTPKTSPWSMQNSCWNLRRTTQQACPIGTWRSQCWHSVGRACQSQLRIVKQIFDIIVTNLHTSTSSPHLTIFFPTHLERIKFALALPASLQGIFPNPPQNPLLFNNASTWLRRGVSRRETHA